MRWLLAAGAVAVIAYLVGREAEWREWIAESRDILPDPMDTVQPADLAWWPPLSNVTTVSSSDRDWLDDFVAGVPRAPHTRTGGLN